MRSRRTLCHLTAALGPGFFGIDYENGMRLVRALPLLAFACRAPTPTRVENEAAPPVAPVTVDASVETPKPAFRARSPQQREHRVVGTHGTDILFEPRAPETKRVAIFLHALCGAAWHFTYTLEDAISSHAWLLSAEGNHACGIGTSWQGNGKTIGEHLDATLARTVADVEGGDRPDPEAPRLLVGFSQGAWAALETAKATPHRYTSLLLIGLALRTNAAELRAAGVRRVVLSAGDRDGASVSMRALCKQLDAEHFPVRYTSLGPVGHTIPLDANARLLESIEWLYRDYI